MSDKLIQNIDKLLKTFLDNYINKISIKYSIPKEELEEILNDNEKIFDNKDNKDNKKNISTTNFISCQYKFSKGANKGELCVSKIKTGCSKYCSKHEKFEGDIQSIKKQLPKAKTSPTPKKNKNSPEKIIRLNTEISKWMDNETELIFDSKDRLIVVGSYRDGKINILTDEDIILCQKRGFKYEREEELITCEDENTNIIIKKNIDKIIDKPKVEKIDSIRKNISSDLNNIYAKDIENVLKELQNPKDDEDSYVDDDEYYEEEED